MVTATDPRLEDLTKAAETFANTDQADLAEGLKDDLAAVKAQVQSLVHAGPVMLSSCCPSSPQSL
jgi:hypothetical protein